MNKLKTAIQKIISDSSKIDWLIVHSISKLDNVVEGIKFSFVDGTERPDEPFKTNQGYISLNNKAIVHAFNDLISELIVQFQESPIALSNLFILVSRASYKGEDQEFLIKSFNNTIGEENSKKVFDSLISSLNKEYYKHNLFIETAISTTDEWLVLFQSAQYSHGYSDPILTVLQLVNNDRNWILDFENIENMSPILRSVLISWYGFDLKISKEKLKILYENEKELSFLSACLIEDSPPNKNAPGWLTSQLIDTIFDKYWDNIGKYVFVHVYGLSFRNKNHNELYKKLEELIHENLTKKLYSDNEKALKLIIKLSFPDDFIALFSWFSIKDIDFNKISTSNKVAILVQFINELKQISKNLPVYISSENRSDPFNSSQLSESKYQNTLAYILLFLLYAKENNLKDIKNICFDFKPLFYGGYESRSLAIHFTELLLLIGLSGNRINGMEEQTVKNLIKLLNILQESLLIPYIHLSERDDEIWNQESERQPMAYNAGKYLVNVALKEISTSTINVHYKVFFKSIDSIKIAQWPYERT